MCRLKNAKDRRGVPNVHAMASLPLDTSAVTPSCFFEIRTAETFNKISGRLNSKDQLKSVERIHPRPAWDESRGYYGVSPCIPRELQPPPPPPSQALDHIWYHHHRKSVFDVRKFGFTGERQKLLFCPGHRTSSTLMRDQPADVDVPFRRTWSCHLGLG